MHIRATVHRWLGFWRPRRNRHESEWDTGQIDLLARMKQGMPPLIKRKLP